jgi:hypothetical protein
VGLDMRWSVHRGRLEASTVFGSILESSGCSFWLPGLSGKVVDEARVGSCSSCFVGSLHDGDAFPHGGQGGWANLLPAAATCNVSSCLVIVDRWWCLSGRGNFLGCSYPLESSSTSIPAQWNITYSKRFLPGGAYPLAAS